LCSYFLGWRQRRRSARESGAGRQVLSAEALCVKEILQRVTLKSMSTSVDETVDRMRITRPGLVEMAIVSPGRSCGRCPWTPLA
jgi:hypothetical protein